MTLQLMMECRVSLLQQKSLAQQKQETLMKNRLLIKDKCIKKCVQIVMQLIIQNILLSQVVCFPWLSWQARQLVKYHHLNKDLNSRRSHQMVLVLQWMPHVEQDLLNFQEHLRSPPIFGWVCAIYSFLCCDQCTGLSVGLFLY